MRALPLIVVCLATYAFAPASARYRDYLVPGENTEIDTYDAAIKRILSQAWRKDVVLRTTVIPSFSKEMVIGLRAVGSNYRAFVVEPTAQIWTQEVKRHTAGGGKPDFSHIRSKYSERPIRNDVAKRASQLWSHVLSDRRNYAQRKDVVYVDGTHFYFFVRLAPHEALGANTVEFDEGTKAYELITVSNALTAFIDGEISDAELLRRLQHSEKRIGRTI